MAKRMSEVSIRLWRVVAGALLLTAVGCQPVSQAPIIDRDPPPSRKITHHYVSRGETLFDIAWRYELDMDALAMVNNLPEPYHLTPGQRISLDIRGERPALTGRTVTASGVIVQAVPTSDGLRVSESPSLTTRSHPLPAPSDEAPAPSEPGVLAPPAETEPVIPPDAAPQPAPSAAPPPAAPVLADGAVDWRWPIPGRVSRHLDSAGVLKGVNIQSTQGTPVYPAAPGVVVYAGDGLRGYGRLIIIKHNNEYLSAYAHNQRILVVEGANVTRESVIAEVGGAVDRPGSLYFEVRRDGKPIDPMEVMPPP